MRAYLGTSKSEVESFLASGSCVAQDIYAPTIKFITAHSDLDEEEAEYEISLIAARASQGLVLALEIPEELVDQHLQEIITVKGPLLWEYVECLFLYEAGTPEEDEEELTWFATQEIKEVLAGLQ